MLQRIKVFFFDMSHDQSKYLSSCYCILLLISNTTLTRTDYRLIVIKAPSRFYEKPTGSAACRLEIIEKILRNLEATTIKVLMRQTAIYLIN